MKNRVLKYVIISLILTLVVINVYMLVEKPKIAFVDLEKLYKEFTYKKELAVKLTSVQEKRKTILDSLEFELSILVNELKKTEGKDKDKLGLYETKRETYLNKAKEFKEDNEAITNEYDEKIWRQLNQYVQDFGKEYNYKFILGAKGDGTIMYASESEDITDKLIIYVNNKYNGINKIEK